MKRLHLCISVAATAIALTLPRPAIAHEDSRRGGWQGGDVTMHCNHGGKEYVASITTGSAKLEIDGKKFNPSRLTYVPFGFVATGSGRSFSAVFTDKKFLVQLKEVQCELCIDQVANNFIEGNGFSFTLFGEDWCKTEVPSPLIGWARLALDQSKRAARDNLLSDKESAHVYVAYVSAGKANEANRPIRNIAELRAFIETGMETGRRAAQSRPGWLTVLLGPPRGSVYKVVSWEVVSDPPDSRCLTLLMTVEAKPPAGSSDLLIENHRRACLGPAPDNRIVAAVFANTYVADDDQAKERAVLWGDLAKRAANSLKMHR